MNYDPQTDSTVAVTNSFPPGAFPEHRLDCTQLSNGAWHCSPVEQQCEGFVELGVVCKNDLEFSTPTPQQGKLINATYPKY